MSHFRSECEHGTLVSQCRCMAPDKEVRIVPCPSHCRAVKSGSVTYTVIAGDSDDPESEPTPLT